MSDPSKNVPDATDLPDVATDAAPTAAAPTAARRPHPPGRAAPVRALVDALRLLRDTARVFGEARAFDHAASISFFALLSLAPFVVLAVSLAGYLAPVLGGGAGVDGVDWLAGHVTDALRAFTPVEGEKVREVVAALVERRASIGAVGAVVLLMGASMAFGALEHALSDVFGRPRHRKFLASRALFATLLVAAGLVLFVAHQAMTLADSLLLAWRGATLDQLLRESALLDAVLTYAPIPVAFLVTLYLPGLVRIPFPCALAGAAAFTVLWEVARTAYAFYVTRVASFGVLYGSLATPLLVILWTFYAANIFLLAASLTAALRARRQPPLASGDARE